MKLAILAVAVAFATTARADDKPKADPAAGPLQIRITGKTKYTLDPKLSGPDAAKAIQAAKGRPPAPPTVELAVEIKNTSDKPVQVWFKGDPVVLELDLKGNGAVNAAPLLAFTREFRLPMATDLAPGKTLEIPIKSLTSGFRGASKFNYWTEAGEYELTAMFKTGVSPAPKGSSEGMDGFGIVTLKSAPLKITVAK